MGGLAIAFMGLLLTVCGIADRHAGQRLSGDIEMCVALILYALSIIYYRIGERD